MRQVMMAALVAAFSCGTCIVTGCHTEGPLGGEMVAGAGVTNEKSRQFVILDREALRKKFSFEDPVTRRTANGRFEVTVGIRNRTDYEQQVDMSAIFRDAQNVPINDESAWTRVIFGPNQTQIYSVTSLDARAANFTVRMREGR